MDTILLRPIIEADNTVLATIIRQALLEFGAAKPGTVYFDESTDYLYQLFMQPGSVYTVALLNNTVVGGAGIYPTAALPAHTCELVKMYLSPAARGKGIAGRLMQQALNHAAAAGYKHVYIETMPELATAVGMYEKFGFNWLDGPLGNSGHTGCSIWMLKAL
jgi:putative acetyltransferase